MVRKSCKKKKYKFICEKCDFKSNNLYNYNKHCNTKKHNDNNDNKDDNKKLQYSCSCGRQYKFLSGLSRHKRICTYETSNNESCHEIVEYNEVEEPEHIIAHQKAEIDDLKSMIYTMMESNKEMQKQLIEIAKQPRTVIKKQNNNTFNLDNFLNIQCKDAMNLSEFVEQLKVTFSDLLYLGDHGFIKSVQNTFVKHLKDLDQTKRPIHCTDRKRKTLYVKDEDKWEKDDKHTKISNAIEVLNKKQLKTFSQHSKQRPEDYLDNEQNINTQHKMITEMCGYNPDTSDDMNKKIVRDLCEIVPIKK